MANKNPRTDQLKNFEKGDPRINRKGRPKLPDINELLAKVLSEEKDGKTAAEAILMAQRAKAARGDTKSAEFLMDRGYGKAVSRTELTGAGGEALISNITRTVISKKV